MKVESKRIDEALDRLLACVAAGTMSREEARERINDLLAAYAELARAVTSHTLAEGERERAELDRIVASMEILHD